MSFDTWQKLKLSDFLEINPKRLVSKDSLISFIDMAALPINGRDILKCNIAEKKFNGGGAKFRNGDTLLARITPCLENGKTAFVNCLSNDDVAFGSTEFIVLAPKNKSDSLFVYYLVRSDNFRSYIIPRMEGTSGRQRVPNNAVGEYECFFPPLNERVEIASILSALDNRISLLRETNTTLEAIAQTLFKSWFVDFDPVKAKAEGRLPEGMDEATAALFGSEFEESALGLIPKGWKCLTLAEAYEINPPRKLKKGEIAPYLDMANVSTNGHVVTEVIQREMGSGTKFRNGDTLLARITPCLENGKTAFVDFLESDGTGWGSTEFVVLHPKAPLPEYHGYLLARYPTFREFAIQSMSGTSGRQRIQNDVLGRYLLAVPSNEIAMAFGNIVECIQKKITENHNQSKTLEDIRDTLLPRLISGQLRLNQAQEIMDEVGA